MATEKKPLTLKQKQTKYRALQYTTFVGKYLALLTPFIVMGCVNAQDWFYQEEGWKVGLGGTLALALLGIIMTLVTKDETRDNKNLGKIALVMGWFTATFIIILFEDILNQMATIMIFGSIGLCAAVGIDFANKDFKNKAELYKTTLVEGKKEILKEQVKKEYKDKDVIF